MRSVPVIALLAIGGCDCETAMSIVSGAMPLAPGETLQLAAEDISSAEACGGFWYVDGVLGGNATHGLVSACGLYTAPAVPPTANPIVTATELESGARADCCRFAELTIELRR